MKIVVCYKCVPEEQDIQVKSDHTPDFANAEWKIGQYDLNAVEAGMSLVEEGDELLALTAAGRTANNSKLRKAILSRGPAAQYAVQDEALESADSYVVAQVLKEAIVKIGGVDLVLCGEGSGDLYAQQVGPMLGALLGWPTVNAAASLAKGDGALTVKRGLENGVEVLEVSLPAVVSVTTDINMPRIPGMKDILGAGKKPYTIWSLAELGATPQNGSQTVSILAPEQTDRRGVIFENDSEDSIATLYSHLRKLV